MTKTLCIGCVLLLLTIWPAPTALALILFLFLERVLDGKPVR